MTADFFISLSSAAAESLLCYRVYVPHCFVAILPVGHPLMGFRVQTACHQFTLMTFMPIWLFFSFW